MTVRKNADIQLTNMKNTSDSAMIYMEIIVCTCEKMVDSV